MRRARMDLEQGIHSMVSRFRFRLAWSAPLAACLLAPTAASAQDATVQEIRIRQLEAQVRELLRQQGPQPAGASSPGFSTGTPANSPMTDMLTRMDALEAQVARLTAQNEEISNRLRQLQPATTAPATASAGPTAPVAPTAAPITPAPAPTPSASASNLAAMTGGASAPRPAPRPAAETPAPSAKATAQRLAAVKAIVKPQTRDAADDEYSYGFRLWQAGFFPEAAQQLKLYLDKYPRHADSSKARNLLGRALVPAELQVRPQRQSRCRQPAQPRRRHAPDRRHLPRLHRPQRIRHELRQRCPRPPQARLRQAEGCGRLQLNPRRR